MTKKPDWKGGKSPKRDNPMLPIDVRNLIQFNHRMAMFVWSPDQWTIVAFIHGYEYGRSGECRFTQRLSDLIAEKYCQGHGPLGWPGQILHFAEARSIGWTDAYLLLSSELLNSELNLIGNEGAATPPDRPYRNTPLTPDDE